MLKMLFVLGLVAVCSAQTNMIGPHSAESDLSAEAFCAGQYSGRGWVYAVRRLCGGGQTCNSICTSLLSRAEDPQTSSIPMWRCFDAVHVFEPFIPTPQRGTNLLSHKEFRYGHCWDTKCGPNYCCCAVDHDALGHDGNEG